MAICARCWRQPCVCTVNPFPLPCRRGATEITVSGEITWSEPQYVLTRAEQRAWLLLRKQYGKAVMGRLLNGKAIHVVAKGGDVYEVGSKWGGDGVRIKNVTTGREMCIIVNPDDLPQGDKLYNVLEWLRVRPEYVERKANTIGMTGGTVEMIRRMMEVVGERQTGDVRIDVGSRQGRIRAEASVRVGFVHRMLESVGVYRRDVPWGQ